MKEDSKKSSLHNYFIKIYGNNLGIWISMPKTSTWHTITKWDSNLWIVQDTVSYIRPYNTVTKSCPYAMLISEYCIGMKSMVHSLGLLEFASSLKMMHTSSVESSKSNRKSGSHLISWPKCMVDLDSLGNWLFPQDQRSILEIWKYGKRPNDSYVLLYKIHPIQKILVTEHSMGLKLMCSFETIMENSISVAQYNWISIYQRDLISFIIKRMITSLGLWWYTEPFWVQWNVWWPFWLNNTMANGHSGSPLDNCL